MTELIGSAPAAGERPPRPDGTGAGLWSVTWRGVRTVARLELRQRVRATRWVVVLVVWAVVVWGLTGLIWAALALGGSSNEEVGVAVFGIVVFLVLGLGSLVAPALSATSVNGDRTAGVLATLQTTLLSPAEIALGKLLAAWTTALALLGTALPAILIAWLIGGTPFGRVLTTLVLLALTLLVVCAVGLACSAIAARTSSSAVLAYITTMGLTLGLPLLFALSLPFTTTTETVRVREPSPTSTGDTVSCVWTTQEMERPQTQRTWWILAPSPYVIVSDAAPRADPGADDDILGGIRDGVRELRLGARDEEDWCGDALGDNSARRAERDRLGPVWPFGLAADVLLAAGSVYVTVRRLRTPTRVLPRGTRVA